MMANHQCLRVLVVGDELDASIVAAAFHYHNHQVELVQVTSDHDSYDEFVHVPPNVHDVLKRLGISIPYEPAASVSKVTELSNLKVVCASWSISDATDLWSSPWLLVSTSHLRKALQDQLSAETTEKAKVRIYRQAVQDVDVDSAAVTLSDGRHVSGDILIGAGGSGCAIRAAFSPQQTAVYATTSLRKFRMQRNVLWDDAEMPELAKDPWQIVGFQRTDSRIAIMPNPDSPIVDVWCYQSGESTGEPFQALTGKSLDSIEQTCLTTRKFYKRPISFVQKGARCALVGSAAHEQLPIFGASITNVVEDAASLVVALSALSMQREISARLQLYADIRYVRSEQLQEFSFVAASGVMPVGDAFGRHLEQEFSHNAYDHAVQRVRAHRWSLSPHLYWRMPIEFGPLPGPRQQYDGQRYASQHSTFTSASIRFKTSRSLLENLFPPGRPGFRFRRPGTIAHASFAQHTFSNLDWLGGGGYNLLGFYIHGVEYIKPNGEALLGTHVPVLFESLTDPILSGREELGMPKLYASIDRHRQEESLRVCAGWQGATWGAFEWHGLEEVEHSRLAPTGDAVEDGLFCYKVMPRVGLQRDGNADSDHPILIPARDESCQPTVKKTWKARDAVIRLNELDWKRLPTMHHIINRLQELPIFEIVEAKVVDGTGVPSALGTHIIV